MSNAANSIGQNINNAGASTASGYTGMANAGSSAVSGLGSTASNYALLSNLTGQNGGTNGLYNAGVNAQYGFNPTTDYSGSYAGTNYAT